VSVITFPRRVDTRPAPLTRRPTARTTTRPGRRAELAHRRSGLVWRGTTGARKSVVVLAFALAVSLGGTMVAANRQVQLHQLQTTLQQIQSSYAQEVGALTNKAAPSEIAAQAGALHLVSPLSVTQVPSTSLDAPLPLPKFNGYAPVTSRTNR
jgi:uncharacterized protein HemX